MTATANRLKKRIKKCNSCQQQVQQRAATVIMSKAQWSMAAVPWLQQLLPYK